MLPREIRDQIYRLLVESPVDPPNTPDDAGLRYTETHCYSWTSKCVLYPAIRKRHYGAHMALAQCSKQLRREVLDIAQNFAIIARTPCELDVMLRGSLLWPTWTYLPPSAVNMKHLKVNLRLFDIRDGGELFLAQEGPGTAFVLLFKLLNRLLHHGPNFFYEVATGSGARIELLTLNVLFGYGTCVQPDDIMFRYDKDPEFSCQRFTEAEYRGIYRRICQELSEVVDQGLLFGKVQRLQVCHEGDTKDFTAIERTLDTAEMKRWRAAGFLWGVDEHMRVQRADVATNERINI